jgi:hypothetical protein
MALHTANPHAALPPPAAETSTVISSVGYARVIGGDVKVPFTWTVTGWFMIGWSAEFSASEVRPLRYFGEDLVAYRDQSGELHVLSGHCRQLRAPWPGHVAYRRVVESRLDNAAELHHAEAGKPDPHRFRRRPSSR